MDKIQLGIVDDSRELRKALISALQDLCGGDVEIVLEAENGSDLLEKLKRNSPQIILMDISMPVMDGKAATAQVRKLHPNIKVIAYSQFDSDINIIDLNLLGVKSFVDKASDMEELIKAIRLVNQGGFYSPENITKVWTEYLAKLGEAQKRITINLNDSEIQLLNLLCQGMSSNQIGNTLCKSPRTIEEHCTNLRRKLGVKNNKELIAFVVRNKII